MAQPLATPRRRSLRLARTMVEAVAARLSPERGAALVTAATAALAVATGRPSRRNRGLRRQIDQLAYRRAREAIRRSELRTAMATLDALERRYPGSLGGLRLRRDLEVRLGNITQAALTLHDLHVREPRAEHTDRERGLVGRIVETTPGWLPRIPGPPAAVPMDVDGVVLHLVKESLPYLTTGFTIRSQRNFEAARSAGLRPVVVTALGFPRHLGAETVPSIELVEGIPHYRLDLGRYYDLDQPVDRVLEDQALLTADVARRIRPAVIHAASGHRGFEHALIGQALRRHLRRPLVYEVRSFHESTWSGEDGIAEVSEHFNRRFDTETQAMRAADHVITIGEAMRREIIERGVDPARVTVVPNGVDSTAFTPRPRNPALARRLGLDGRFVFGYVSNMDHSRENQELLIAATRILLDRGRRVRCLIIGDGRRRHVIEDAIAAAGVGHAVVLTGRIEHEDVPDHYALFDAFVVPRRDERAARLVTPLKPYEAMAMARPLVVADLPALVEVAAPGVRGLSFPPDDPHALAAMLERLIDDPDLGTRLGEAGRRWVVSERTWHRNGQRLREVYRDVLRDWRRREQYAA